MKGTNLFPHILRRSGREYLTESFATEMLKFGSVSDLSSPCIFLSHKGNDKQAVKEIGEYIKNAGINIYLDVEDAGLQNAVKMGLDVEIVKYIELGLKNSTHLMAVVSDVTKNSWWVPYEIGYAKKNKNELSTLKLKDVTDLPSFLKITEIIADIYDLNSYLKKVNNRLYERSDMLKYVAESVVGDSTVSWRQPDHPLRQYLATIANVSI